MIFFVCSLLDGLLPWTIRSVNESDSDSNKINDNDWATTAPLLVLRHLIAANKSRAHRETVASTPLELCSTGCDARTVFNINPVIGNNPVYFQSHHCLTVNQYGPPC